VLFPEIEKRRAQFEYGGDAVLIIDGCTCHDSDWLLDEASGTAFVLSFIWFPASFRPIKTQPLDLGLFGLTKQAISKVRLDPDKTVQSSQLIRMFCAWHIAATP
jgi:hypothetical protein